MHAHARMHTHLQETLGENDMWYCRSCQKHVRVWEIECMSEQVNNLMESILVSFPF